MQVQLYISRAADFIEGMKYTRDDESCWSSAALLATHSAISYSDALRSGLGDQKLASDDHADAVTKLQRLVGEADIPDQAGFTHLRYLLSKKNEVAYGRSRLSSNDYKQLWAKAERFQRWANQIGRQLQIEGWTDED